MIYERAMALCEALESGEFEQGKHQLEKDGKFCCLGVASFLAAQDPESGVTREVKRDTYDNVDYAVYRSEDGVYDYSNTSLIHGVAKWLGLKQQHSGNIYFPSDKELPLVGVEFARAQSDGSAMGMNDSATDQKDFKFIAAKIRKEWADL